MQVSSTPCTSFDAAEEDSHHRFPDGLGDTPQLGVTTHTNLLHFIQRLGSVCRRKCLRAEGQRKGSSWQESKSSYCLFNLVKQSKRRWELKLMSFRGRIWFPLMKLFGIFCSLSVGTMQSVMFIVVCFGNCAHEKFIHFATSCSKCSYQFFPKDWFLACCSTVHQILNAKENGW